MKHAYLVAVGLLLILLGAGPIAAYGLFGESDDLAKAVIDSKVPCIAGLMLSVGSAASWGYKKKRPA